jgi:hypothetical protein
MALMACRGPSASSSRFQPLNVKKTKKAKSSFFLVELLMWSKKQKWSYDPAPESEPCRHNGPETQIRTKGVVVVRHDVGERV